MAVTPWFPASLRPSHAEGRMAPMDGMRGIAVLLVFFIHYHAVIASFLLPGSLVSVSTAAAASVGYTGVDVFFALSGFLIYGGIIRKKVPYGVFLLKRAKRIYPAFLVVLSAYILLSAVFAGESRIPRNSLHAYQYITWNVLLLPGILPIQPILTVAWTLSYEFCFYLFVPILVGVLGMRNWRPERRFLLLALCIAGFTVLAQLGWNPYGEMIMFGAGMLAFELTRIEQAARYRTRAAELLTLTLVVLTIALIAVRPMLIGRASVEALAGRVQFYSLFLSVGLVIWFANAPESVVSRTLSSGALRLMGTISYSYYLIHGLVLNFLRLMLNAVVPHAFRTETFALLLFPVAIVLTIAAACLLFVTVEYPSSVRTSPPMATPINEPEPVLAAQELF